MTPRFQLLITTALVLFATGSGQTVPAQDSPPDVSTKPVATSEPARLTIDGRTIRIHVQSDWQFSPDDARREADDRLLDTLWPLVQTVEPHLPESVRAELPRLWVTGPGIRRDRAEERARAYGDQTRLISDLELVLDDLPAGVRTFKPRPWLLTLLSLAGLLIINFALAAWLDRLTNGYRREPIQCGLWFLNAVVVMAALGWGL